MQASGPACALGRLSARLGRNARAALGLLVALLAFQLGPRSAAAERPAVPATLPNGYVMEADANVAWVYPEAAEGEVPALKETLKRTLVELSNTFGQPIDGPLDIRIATHAADMPALAPSHPVPDYAEGVAYPSEGLILLTFSAPLSFGRPNMEQVLVHEVAHVALARAVQGHPVPRWFTEGVAIHMAEERSLERLKVLWEASLRKRLLPLVELSTRFPAAHHDVNLAYAQSADFVGYLLDGDDDRRRFSDLLTELRAGTPFAEAIKAAYGVTLGYVEREWRAGLLRTYGRWPTAFSGMTLLWALGALLLFAGYVRARRKHHRTLDRWAVEEAMEQAGAPAAVPPPPPGSTIVVRALTGGSTTPSRQQILDEFFDERRAASQRDGDVPTVEHDGRSYTLH